MIGRLTLLVLIPLVAACSAPVRSAPPSPASRAAAASPDTTLFLLDGERIVRADVPLIDPLAIESVSHWVGDAARRFGLNTREVVEITSKKERRGPTASEAPTAPLFLLDGRVMPAALFNVLDAKRIEKVDVLKGAAAAERYGERGRSGVIMITTKPAASF